MLALAGWTIEGELPDAARMMLIVVPHTSNWDFPVGLMAKFALRLECRFIAKHSLFWWPFGVFLHAIGGIPVDRAAAGDVVEGAVRAFAARERLILVLTPEGTRSKVERWKSGFHRIARAAGVPIALGVLDYGRRAVRLGPAIMPGDDYEHDLALLQSHVAPSMARHPENY